MKKAKITIDPNRLRVRDYALVRLINGATKAGPHRDRKREAKRKACRRPLREEE